MKLQKLAIAVAVMAALSACSDDDDKTKVCPDGTELDTATNECIVVPPVEPPVEPPVTPPEETDFYNSDNWEESFPEQYKTWAQTAESNPASGVPTDLLEANPNLVSAWAGYGFAKDYNRARGHHFALTDIIKTLRTGAPMVGHDGKVVGEAMAASCWSCKTTDLSRMYDEVGEGKFADNGWSVWGEEMSNTIGCADCHELGENSLRLSRPYASRAMDAIDMTFTAQNHDSQASQTCAQCHVEYYFDGTDSKKVRYPWDHWVPGVETDYANIVDYKGNDDLYKGFAAEAQLAFYDEKNFKDWTNAISGAPSLKAQHPEYENLLDRTDHMMGNHLDFSCNTCHMPKANNADGVEYSNHKVTFDATKLPESCTGCHDADAFESKFEKRKAEINELRFTANGTDPRLTEAHFKAQAIWAANGIQGLEAGKTIGEAKAAYEAALAADNTLANEMTSLLTKVRNAQWFWDSATASHGIFAHNPAEAKRLLNKANTILDAAIIEADALLAKYDADYAYDATKYDTKAKVQPLAGLNLEAMKADKEEFIKERVEKEWPATLH
ncbi:ammonia-forming cytochrome c nitrite reductase subunit c552 [Shewanella schlegeliana]|uniref:nitrite reductase (cytochrome; ammonia-forming) n=1 Tax=Shewanella schlegeliana TaxID=190308 RepID=A0ABS1SX07_9GAMM|nr:ammonia-forming cytochrome c nitrite reductase subunit c552 [Shewanella schlegeliana]MBL4912924.1 ammonia-forming cytochrome c nitrite reductase subunit c552 [Shewanella schlegeliana]MCL1108980.1 ammonia-forming cytochrome c nitrite reductase subunit c552 [Shewanella schlegeliana]GIU23464.1 cytochrome c-552 [Shewanella schlegeliana]